MSEWNMYDTLSEGKMNNNTAYTCTLEEVVSTLLAGGWGERDNQCLWSGRFFRAGSAAPPPQ